ncbi:hypothetical protein C6P44_000733 [Monosporozyma unispora]|nr:hypothetical protein C6P44_000733 [Kazachstania unispora]
MNTSTDTLTTTDTTNTITPRNYPINAHITIHYQNWSNPTATTSSSEEKESTPRKFQDLSYSTSLSSSSSESSTTSLNNLILPKHNNSYSFSHNYNNINNINNINNHTTLQEDTPLRIVQTVLNISNQYNNNITHQNDIEQCQNTNTSDVITPLVRRFSEPIYIDRDDLLKNCTAPLENENEHEHENEKEKEHYPKGNACTRHHHRRNSIAIKFNKPSYKKCL